MAKPVLGRGLGALLGGESSSDQSPTKAPTLSQETAAPKETREGILRVPLAEVEPSSLQPRQDFDMPALKELADSIRSQGILQPLLVRRRGNKYELIAGERRWRASRLAGLTEVPVMVRESSEQGTLELMLIENLQREDLNPLEEALGYAELLDQFHLTQEEIAIRVGKSRSAVANALRLLQLATPVQQAVRAGKLSVGHAKVILGLKEHRQQTLAAERVERLGLNVRETERLVEQWGKGEAERKASKEESRAPAAEAHLRALESKMQEHFATKVTLKYRGGKGTIEVKFFNDEELNRILDLLGVKLE